MVCPSRSTSVPPGVVVWRDGSDPTRVSLGVVVVSFPIHPFRPGTCVSVESNSGLVGVLVRLRRLPSPVSMVRFRIWSFQWSVG